VPRAFDRRQLTITHDPTRRITEELPKTPPFAGPTQLLPNGDHGTPIVQELIDAIVKGFTAWNGQTGFGTGVVQDFAATVAEAIGTLGTLGIRLAKLENGGALIFEDFSTYPNSPGLAPAWIQTYKGDGDATLGVTNKYAVTNLTPNTSKRTCYAIHTTASPDHKQKVSLTVSTPQDVFDQSENLIICRYDNGDYVFAGMTWKKIRIGYMKGGQRTVLASKSYLFRNASTYTLDCLEDRQFRLLENSKEILSATDKDAASTLGKSAGFATFCPNGLARPGVVGSFATYVS
jgi:hypothetical protein